MREWLMAFSPRSCLHRFGAFSALAILPALAQVHSAPSSPGAGTRTVRPARPDTKATGTLTTLYSFCPDLLLGNCTDGFEPASGLLQATDGNFYGTTPDGGAYGIYGTIFKITPSGTLTTLYSFCSQSGCADGFEPVAGLIQGTDGNFYGTTLGGGAAYPGYGSIFLMTPSGAMTTLYSFCQAYNGTCPDGANPYAGMVQGTDGNFYGTTSQGGANPSPGGTVFKVTPGGMLTTLYSFCSQSGCTDGRQPMAGLVQATDGNFYGTTQFGGVNGYGTVFQITPSGTLTTLYSFCSQSGCTDGRQPLAGLVQAANADFYGTTGFGGANGDGTIFTITASGTLTTLYGFCSQSGCADGGFPQAGLVQAANGDLYGTTSHGGANFNSQYYVGTVFKITLSGNLTTLYSFCSLADCADGASPSAPLIQGADGSLYGTTTWGGANNYGTDFDGTVFVLCGSGNCTGTAVVSSLNPSTYGGAVTFTATVAPVTGSGSPTGSVSFANGRTPLGSADLAGGVASLNTAALPAGQDTITASYSGDANFDPSNGSLTQIVNQAATSTIVTSNINPSVYLQPLTFVADVLPATGSGTATGSVVFEDGSKKLGTVTLSGGSASLSPARALDAGTHAITASYSANPSCCLASTGSLSQVVNQATTATASQSSANPALVNQPVTFTAAVTAQYGGSPTGTVTFYSNGTQIGSPVQVASRKASIATAFANSGTFSITAVYSGDLNFMGSSARPLAQTVGLTISTTTYLKSSGSPSMVGQPVTFTATVKPVSGSIPDGETITFYDGATSIGTGTTASGIATLATWSLPLGTDPIAAAYLGDGGYLPSASRVVNQRVNKNTTTTALMSGTNPSTYGQSVTFTATVSSGGPTPTGTVTFKNGSAAIGVGTLSGGVATLVYTGLAAGTASITAEYKGDANSANSTSAPLSQSVTQAATATAVASSKNPSKAGQSVTFTSTVTSAYATPIGTVTFTQGATTLGTATLAAGEAKLAVATLPAGTDTVTATYTPSTPPNFSGSSGSIAQTVD